MIDEKIISEYETMVEYLKYLASHARESSEIDLDKMEDKLLGYITDCFAYKVKESL